jgi:EAL domain-containing protein (putative c-di-GMP-specific phosphodiesterase class I)
MDIELLETHMIIRNQPDFTEFVSGSCQLTIDFTVYDLGIGKKGLANANSSID